MAVCQLGIDGKKMPGANTKRIDDYNFSLIEDCFGYNSTSDKTKLDPRFMVRGSKNVVKKVSGTVASREGLKRRGAVDSTSAGVKSSFEWETSLGTRRHLRVANGKLEVESDILVDGEYLWYELFLTSTITSIPTALLTRFVFDPFWDDDDKKDRLLFVRGDSNIFNWSGGMAVVSSSTADTITKAGTATWAEAGFAITVSAEKKIMIGGREFTYTGGETTTTLTGVTASSGDASTITPDSVAIQSVFSDAGGSGQMFPASFSADFLRVENNQAIVGSYSSRVVYISTNLKRSLNPDSLHGFQDFTNALTHIPGDPDLIVLDNLCKGIGFHNGQLAIFAGQSDLYLVTMNKISTIQFADLFDGTNRFYINEVTKKKLPNLQGSLGHEFIGNFGEYLVWLDQNHQLRALGTFSNSLVQKPVHLSIQVQEELSEDNFTGGHLRVIEDTIHITAPNNGRDWMYQIREIVNDNGEVVSEKIWQPPQLRGLSRIAVFEGVIHGHSNVNPQVYQVFDTNQWTDDHPSEEPIPYTCMARFAYRQLTERSGNNSFVRRQGLLTFDKIYFEGYTSEGVYLYTNVYFEYQGAKAMLTVPINDPEDETEMARFWLGNSAPSFGDSPIGDTPLGDGILEESNEQESLPKFRRIADAQVINCFEYMIEIFSVEPDSRWEILAFGPNVSRASEQPTYLR